MNIIRTNSNVFIMEYSLNWELIYCEIIINLYMCIILLYHRAVCSQGTLRGFGVKKENNFISTYLIRNNQISI